MLCCPNCGGLAATHRGPVATLKRCVGGMRLSMRNGMFVVCRDCTLISELHLDGQLIDIRGITLADFEEDADTITFPTPIFQLYGRRDS